MFLVSFAKIMIPLQRESAQNINFIYQYSLVELTTAESYLCIATGRMHPVVCYTYEAHVQQ